jgi:hypothetical protein
MKKLSLPALLFVFWCSFTACQPEWVAPERPAAAETQVRADARQAACTNYYYYDGKERADLGTVLTDRIVVGFQDGTSAAQKKVILSPYGWVDSVESSLYSGSADATVVLLRPNLSCSQVEQGLLDLVQHPAIRYANPVFNRFQQPWDNGLTNQLILTLQPEHSRADLEKVAQRYGVEVVEDLGANTYVLSVDKTSGATTLQAANLIARSDKVLACTPDFLLLPAGNELARKEL